MPRAWTLGKRELSSAQTRPYHFYSFSIAQGMAGAGSSGLPLATACLGLWSYRDSSRQWGPIPGLVSQAEASVVNKGWADAGLPAGSLVDWRQLAPSTALTMYLRLATDTWPQTIPTAYLISGTILPIVGGLCQKCWCRGKCLGLLLWAQARESGICSLRVSLVSAPSH